MRKLNDIEEYKSYFLERMRNMLKRYMATESVDEEYVSKACNIPKKKIEDLLKNISGNFSLQEVIAMTLFCGCRPRIMFKAPRAIK